MGKHDRMKMPFKHLISFEKLLTKYDEHLKGEDPFLAATAERILAVEKGFPELRNGFSDFSLLEKNKDLIDRILQDTFTEALSSNEIKVATLPYQDVIIKSSKRFQSIIHEAGDGYEPEIRNVGDDMDYIMSCVVVLNYYYGYKLDFSRPYFYDIPDANGVMRHYRILYNADFIDVIPTDKAKEVTQEDVDELLANPTDIKLWKEKIPPESFISKGFVIANLFDVTMEQAISNIKSKLISKDTLQPVKFMNDLQETFKSFFRLPNIKVGFASFDAKKDQFEEVAGIGFDSFLLRGRHAIDCKVALCEESYHKLIDFNSYFTITDMDRMVGQSGEMQPYKGLQDQGVQSAIFAPIAYEGKLLGILEIVSQKKGVLNGVNAQKLDDVMPFIVSAVVRTKNEENNRIDAIIQNECTSVHSSVYWRFQEEAKRFMQDEIEGRSPSFKEIVFKDVYPLFGQIDIKDSSQARNLAIQRDLMIQLSEIDSVLNIALKKWNLPIYEELIFRVNNHLDSIKEMLYTNSEQAIFDFVQDEISPVFEHLKKADKDIENHILAYESKIDMGTGSYYDHRKNYDESVTLVNKTLSSVIDKRQESAQNMFPHYYERYKTDGVEHNMYIGSSISESKEYNPLYLNNLRLWQLQVMCEMENAHYSLKPKLPVPLDAASLILVYNTSLSIRFRMDEKQFDVDGTYNARYEVIKKRIDKSYIKGTEQRLTQKGVLSIVYSQKKDELEYLRYIKFLKSKGYFTNQIEIVELEGLQGVSGLKAIRAQILYKREQEPEKTYTYQDLMDALKE
ncbi:GAF domain-containing protein [Maribacter sp. 1_2014MBL_MicDiv]|uniref:GAF domain-containing protein n=1 Tax=Maribacter sp. 1_2014MBL_MicDiv TaxID=1644130 RepID=UPI0008F48EE8|nr:GAF domain-containing protein [Maribacter sp. 1_2014MBL_MicDiv]APA63902.1 cell surface protein [Maribacter sp. 1_2014MBL_MicDiv]